MKGVHRSALEFTFENVKNPTQKGVLLDTVPYCDNSTEKLAQLYDNKQRFFFNNLCSQTCHTNFCPM